MTLILFLTILGGIERVVFIPGFEGQSYCQKTADSWAMQAADPEIPNLLKVEAYCRRAS